MGVPLSVYLQAGFFNSLCALTMVMPQMPINFVAPDSDPFMVGCQESLPVGYTNVTGPHTFT